MILFVTGNDCGSIGCHYGDTTVVVYVTENGCDIVCFRDWLSTVWLGG